MYQALCKKIKLPEYQEKLGDSLKTFVGVTENGAWKNLVPKGKKVMVISMEGTSLVRSAGVAYGADIGPSKVVNRFPLLTVWTTDALNPATNFSIWRYEHETKHS